jgi:DNA adenine methylase Dam
MGNKEKLIQKGLIDLFPKNINTFIDLFSGSCVVSMNVKASKYVINDIDEVLFNLYLMFKENTCEQILAYINKKIEEFNLDAGIHKQGWNKKYPNEPYPTEEQNKRKINYNKFRDYYNKYKNIIDLYILSIFCNSHNIRFNSSGDFNMSIGNSGYCSHHIEEIKNTCVFFKQQNIYILNKDYKIIDINKIHNDDFIYFDPPYSNTLAIYNEQQGWSVEDDYKLFEICEQMNLIGIKWGLSNVFSNKQNINQHLIDWCEKNKWQVYSFDGHKYTSCGKGNSQSEEVYICNY